MEERERERERRDTQIKEQITLSCFVKNIKGSSFQFSTIVDKRAKKPPKNNASLPQK